MLRGGLVYDSDGDTFLALAHEPHTVSGPGAWCLHRLLCPAPRSGCGLGGPRSVECLKVLFPMCEDYPGRRPLRTACHCKLGKRQALWLRSEGAFLEKLQSLDRSRVLLATGLRFRTDLATFGGPGLGYAVQLLKRGGFAPF